ncbi:MAG: isoquinoline 1-oxidoreductase beta subunit [Rhodothermales bacterium]|jgi:isoquinoline 1-oxidoreductase beta subunit
MGKWTRRGFITAGVVGGAALVVGIAIRPGNQNSNVAKYVTGDGESLINIWVKIDQNNHVTAIVPHSEMGQGAQTALTQMLADELDANWDDVSFVEAPAEDAYANGPMGKGFILGDTKIPEVLLGSVDGLFMTVASAMHLQITGGSTSIRATGVYGMRVAGAAAREMLLEAASSEWSVPVSKLTAKNGMISDGERSATYATFAAAAGQLQPPYSPKLKSADQFTIMGKSKPRLDIPSKVDGTAMFGIDAEVEGMVYATIMAAPVFGASVKSVNSDAASKMSGVIDVVNLDDAVAVVANSYWTAKKALATVKVEWQKTGPGKMDSDKIFAQFQNDITAGVKNGDVSSDRNEGDAASAFENANRIVEREYRVPYLAHACMEPMNALAMVADGHCEVWTGTQNPLGFKYQIAEALELEAEHVTVNNFFMGGGFGRRSTPDAAIQAAKISQRIGQPVKLIWSREEDIQHDHYRPAVVSQFRAALDASGQPTAWENHYVDKHEPAEAPLIPYSIANQAIGSVASPTHVPFGPWRSVDHSQHGFFTESFIDELAAEAGEDPFAFRMAKLKGHPRHSKVLALAAEKGNWSAPLAKGQGRGIALQESFGTLVAEVVDVTVREGKVNVDKVTIAVDPGFAVSPDGLKAQMESGVIYGLTAALFGEITIKDGRVEQGNFDSYPMVRMDSAPKIETHIINSMETWGGAGEPGTPGIAPALANAIYAATGTRIRELPVSKYDLNVEFVEKSEVRT